LPPAAGFNVCAAADKRYSLGGKTMVNRRPVQEQHERAVVRDFLVWLNARRGTYFKVIAEPTPPEAIIRSVRVTSWVEVTDAFWTDGYAKDLYSYATPSEEHKPVGPGPFVGMDESLARRFAQALANKLKKRSYLPFLEKYGQGYLLVPLHHPCFNGGTVQEMKNLWRARQPVENLGCFKEVYIAFSSLNRRTFRRWHV
jgi:hypothetical protein